MKLNSHSRIDPERNVDQIEDNNKTKTYVINIFNPFANKYL